jgi:hypothetical protein
MAIRYVFIFISTMSIHRRGCIIVGEYTLERRCVGEHFGRTSAQYFGFGDGIH